MTDPKPRSPLWMRVLLIASLALNLLIVGVIAGSFSRHDGRHDRRAGGPDLIAPYARAIAPEDRRKVGRDLARAFRSDMPDRRSWRAGFSEVLALLRQEEFDRPALEEKLAEQADTGKARHVVGRRVFLDYLEGLSVEERRAFAGRLEAEVKRRLADRK